MIDEYQRFNTTAFPNNDFSRRQEHQSIPINLLRNFTLSNVHSLSKRPFSTSSISKAPYKTNNWAIDYNFPSTAIFQRRAVSSDPVLPSHCLPGAGHRLPSEETWTTERKTREHRDDIVDSILPVSIQDQLATSGAQALPVETSSAPASIVGIEEDTETPAPRSMSSKLSAMPTSKPNPQAVTAAQQETSPASDQSKTQSQSNTQQENTSSLPLDHNNRFDRIKVLADESEKLRRSFESAASTGASRLTHLNTSSEVHMVSIASKKPTQRIATAIGYVPFSAGETLSLVRRHALAKGDVLATSRSAGIMAVKKTSDIVILAHPGLAIEAINVLVEPVGPESDSKSKDTLELLTKELEDRGRQRNFDSMLTRQMGRGIGSFGGVRLACTVQCNSKTGVEMEALTGVTGAALSVIDMCKSVDKNAYIGAIQVVRKEGGRTGPYMRLLWD